MTPPGGWELIVILFIILLLFGSRKLPDLASSVGKSIKEFRRGTQEALDEEEQSGSDDTSTSSTERDRES